MIEIDACHRQLIAGMVAAAKPTRILELGFGTGATTKAILSNSEDAHLTIIDNWLDFGENKPLHAALSKTRLDRISHGAKLVTADEREFLASTPDNTFDFLVSDADHTGDWCEEHFRVTKPGSWCFFHDTNQPAIYPGLARTVDYVRERGWMHYHFTKSTLPDEKCERGLLMVLNSK
jgi:predicted O-methyltransferase YrrM